MTKVSMRHLNEIVRERNQYSRDALEAWQDFINLKGRLDTELSKVTKRNNYLNDELENWKQQVGLNMTGENGSGFLTLFSSLNSKPLPTPSPKRHRILRLRSKGTSARIAASPRSSINRRTMRAGFRSVSLALRSSVTMPSRPLFFSRRLPKNSRGSARGTGRSLALCSTLI